MSDKGFHAGSFREETPAADIEIPLNLQDEEPSYAHPDQYSKSQQQQPEVTYQNTPPPSTPLNEPKNVRINLYDRDPTDMNNLVKVRFDDIFAEPQGSHSFDKVWTASHTVFTGTKHWCYRILSAIFAVPCAFCWGLHFACLTFNYIWAVQPSLRSCAIELRPLAKIWGLCVRSFFDPLFESVGLVFSKIKFSLKKEG